MLIGLPMVVFILTVLGAGWVFGLGHRQFTDYFMQSNQGKLRELLQNPGKRSSQGLLAGLWAGVISGGGFSGMINLLTAVNAGKVSIRRANWFLMGLTLGSMVSLAMYGYLGFFLNFPGLGLFALVLSMMFQYRSSGRSISVSTLFSGLGLALLGIALLNGYLQLIPYNGAVAGFLREFFQTPQSWILGFFLGGLLVLIYRNPFSVWMIVLSLGFRGWIPPILMWVMVLGAQSFFPIILWVAALVLNDGSRQVGFFYSFYSVSGALFAILISILFWVPGIPAFVAPLLGTSLIAFMLLITAVTGAFLKTLFEILAAKLTNRLSPALPAQINKDEHLRLVPDYYPDSLSINLTVLRDGLSRMAYWDHEMLMIILNISQDGTWDQDSALVLLERVRQVGELGGAMVKEITRLVQHPSSPAQAQALARQQLATSELGKISDSCRKLLGILERSKQKKYRFHQEGNDELFDFTAQVLDFLKYNSDFLSGAIESPDWNLAKSME
jgi:phosphate:Na+ symporter